MSLLGDVFNLPRVLAPYVLHPLTGCEVFFPHTRPVTWVSGSKPFIPEQDISSLTGKVILVTGGNTGLGKESIYQLALSKPARIYLAARSCSKAEAAIQDIVHHLGETSSEPHCEIEYLELDLCNLNSVREAAKTVLRRESRLDVLMLNAGVMATPTAKTEGGHDLQLGTNHIGHFLLTRLLLPLLEKTAVQFNDSDVRIVTVSSEAHRMAPSNLMELIEDQTKLCSLSPFTRYGVSKAANIVFAAELARRYGQKHIQSVSVHPGLILTDLYVPTRNANFLAGFGLPSMASMFFDDVKHGALNQIWCAAGASKQQLINGSYYTPIGKERPSPLTRDEASGQRLWEWTTQQVRQYLN